MSELYAVVMAGGGGTRLWPVSRRGRPKQLLRLVGDHSLFGTSIDRLKPWLPLQRILVATSTPLAGLLRDEEPDLLPGSFILEPSPKGTAPVLGLAATLLRDRDPDAVMAVLTSDHAIGDPERLRRLLEAGAELAASGKIVTLGIPPETADTGYGYIERGRALQDVRGEKAFEVAAFREKPDPSTAERYLADGAVYWNAGMFLWRPARLLAEIERWMPDLHRVLSLLGGGGDRLESETFRSAWEALEPQTIDYGVMEHAADVVVLEAQGLGWTDIGSWDRVYELLKDPSGGNVVLGALAVADQASGNLVVAGGDETSDRLVVLQGVSDLVVVETSDAILICRRDQAARVRDIVDRVEKDGLERFLR